jgi:hypothetical protein
MIVTRKSCFTGKLNQMSIDMDPQAFETALREWEGGKLIQEAFPDLSADEREFLMTGSTPAEWQEIFGSDDDD